MQIEAWDFLTDVPSNGGAGLREQVRDGRREGGKEGRREGGKEGRREGGKEGRRVTSTAVVAGGTMDWRGVVASGEV